MEAVNGVSDGGPPPPSPLTGCYLLVVIGEPHSQEHKDIILRRVSKGLLSWDVNDCMVDLEKELAIITEQAPEGEEARYGERLIQYASENLVTEILIHPAVSTLSQCVRNLLSSFTRHRHIIHSGYTFAANGSWALQDGTFSLADFAEAFQELEVQRVIRAYENGISVDIHCAPEGDWMRLPKEPFAKNCKVRLNPVDVLSSSSPAITNFLNYITPYLVPIDIVTALESSEVVGNIRFSHPTLYVFPGGQGDAALFGINGFNMLLDGGFSRKACFWDFVRHLDRLDAVLLTRLNNSNVCGITSVLRRKRQNAVYPQIGHFFCNIQERKALLSPDGDKDRDPLVINLLEEGHDIVTNLKHLNMQPQTCYRDSEPINLYHKVGHGTLDMYVLSPAKDSREVREFIQKWNTNDGRLFANSKTKDFSFPLPNLVSICALLVWQPSSSTENITRILFPGSTPQSKIFEGLDRLKQLDCIKYPVCSDSTLNPPKKTKEQLFDSSRATQRILPDTKKEKSPRPVESKPTKDAKDASKQVDNKSAEIHEAKKEIKKSDSTDSDKSAAKPINKIENKVSKETPPRESATTKALRAKDKDSRSLERKPIARMEKKPSPTTPKKSMTNGDANKRSRISPTSTPAKSAKEATNRKVLESKKQAPKKETKPLDKKEPEKKVERKPISRRPKPAATAAAAVGPAAKAATGSPIRKKPDSIAKKAKLDKEGTTDSSTVSTPTTDADVKRDISKLTPEELDQLKAQELADLQEEQEIVQEIEAVFRKGEENETSESELRKVKNISIEEKTDEEYLVVEKVVIQEDEIQKLTRDSEESEKQRKLSEPKVEEVVKEIASPEEKVDKLESGTQPDEKFSATVESGATTAPTLPEDERIPLDEIKEKDDTQIIEEKHVKEDTKEKEPIPTIQLPSKSIETPPMKVPPVVGIRLDKQQHIRDIVKTPDEVADLPVHEVADQYADYQKATDDTSPTKDVVQDNTKIVEASKAKEDVVKVVEDIKPIVDESKDIPTKTDHVGGDVTELKKEIKEEVVEKLEIKEMKQVQEETVKAVEETVSEVHKTAVDISHEVKEEILEVKESVKELQIQESKEQVDTEEEEEPETHEKVVSSTETKKDDGELVCDPQAKSVDLDGKTETVEDVPKVVSVDEIVEPKEEISERRDTKESIQDEVEETIEEKIDQMEKAIEKVVTSEEDIKAKKDEITETIETSLESATTHVEEINESVTKVIEQSKETITKIEETKEQVQETVVEKKDVKAVITEKVDDTKEVVVTESEVSKTELVTKQDESKEVEIEVIKIAVQESEVKIDKDTKEVAEIKTVDEVVKEVKETVEIKDTLEADVTKTAETSDELADEAEKDISDIVEEVTKEVSDIVKAAKNAEKRDEITTKASESKITVIEKVEEVKQEIETHAKETKQETEIKVDEELQKIETKAEEAKEKIETKLEEIKKDVIDHVAATDEKTKEVADTLKKVEDAIKDSTEDAKKDITDVVSDVEQQLEEIKESATDKLKDEQEIVADEISKTIQKADQSIKTTTDIVTSEVKEVEDAAKDDIEEVKDEIKDIKETLAEQIDAVREGASDIKNVLEDAAKSVADMFHAEKDSIKDKVDEIKESAEDSKESITVQSAEVKDIVSESVEAATKDAKEVVSTAAETVKTAGTEIKKDLDEKISEAEKTLASEVESVKKTEAATIQDVTSGLEEKAHEVDDTQKTAAETATEIISDIKQSTDQIKVDIKEDIEDITTTLTKTTEETIETTEIIKEEVQESVTKSVNEIKEHVEEVTSEAKIEIKEHVEEVTSEAKIEIKEHVEEVTSKAKIEAHKGTDAIVTVKDDLVKEAKDVVDELKETKDTVEEIKETITEKAQSVSEAITKSVDTLIDTTKAISDSFADEDTKKDSKQDKVADDKKDEEKKPVAVDDKPTEETKTIDKTSIDEKSDDKKVDEEKQTVVQTSIVVEEDDTRPDDEDDKDHPESPCPTPFEFIDKADLGRKSPKEREQDVAKIVASVAEVLKSEAPLEDFKGKIPLEITTFPTFTPYTTELRETHITTVDSPTTDLPGQITPIKEEKIDEVLEEMQEDIDSNSNKSKISELIKTSNELLEASSKMISGIKERQEEEKIQEPEEDKDDKVDTGTVHRMLVTASSEDGGEETVICPPGSITFSKSSESSGRSSPDLKKEEVKVEVSSPESSQDAPSVLQKEPEISAKMLSEDIPEKKDKTDQDIKKPEADKDVQDNKEVEAKIEADKSERSTPDLSKSPTKSAKESSGRTTPESIKQDSVSGKATPEATHEKEVIESKDTVSGKSTPDTKSSLKEDKSQKEGSDQKLESTHEPESKPSKGSVEIEDLKSDTESKTLTTEPSKEDEKVSYDSKELPVSEITSSTVGTNGKASPETGIMNDIAAGSSSDSGKVSPETGIFTKETTQDITRTTHSTTAVTIHVENERLATTQADVSGKTTPELPKSGTESPAMVCCRRPDEPIPLDRSSPDHLVDGISSGRSTPEVNNISSKSTPGVSGKSTPDIPKSPTSRESLQCDKSLSPSGKATPDVSKSGKSSPDFGKGDSIKLDTDSLQSGKVSPDLHTEVSGAVAALTTQIDTDSLASGKITPDMDKQTTQLETDSLASGKITPDVLKSDVPSGKSTPDVCKRDSLAASDKLIPSGKSTPDIPKDEIKDIQTDVDSSVITKTPEPPAVSEKSEKSALDKIDSDHAHIEDLKTDVKMEDEVPSEKISVGETSKRDSIVLDTKISTDKTSPELFDKETAPEKSEDVTESSKITSEQATFKSEQKESVDIHDQQITPEDVTEVCKLDVEKIQSGKTTPDKLETKDTIERKESLTATSEKSASIASGKSTPEPSKDIDQQRKQSLQIDQGSSGKSTPDPNAAKDIPSGKSTPSMDRKDSHKPDDSRELKHDSDILSSGKITPDIVSDSHASKRSSIQIDEKEQVASDKSTVEASKTETITQDIVKLETELKQQIDKSETQLEKSTPEQHKPELTSGKASPTSPDRKDLSRDSIPSGKSTPGLSGKLSPDPEISSGKTSPLLKTEDKEKDTADVKVDAKMISRKSISDLESTTSTITTSSVTSTQSSTVVDSVKVDTKCQSVASESQSPDLSKRSSMQAEHVLSGKSTPDSTKVVYHSEELHSGKSTPDFGKRSSIQAEQILSGKSTPDLGKPGSTLIDQLKTKSGKSSPDVAVSEIQGKVTETVTTTKFDTSQLQSAHVFRELMEETISSSLDEKKPVNGDVIHEKHEVTKVEAAKEILSGKSTPDLAKDSRKSSVMSVGEESDYRKFSITSENTKTSSMLSGKSTPDVKEESKHTVQAFIDAERYVESTPSPSKSGSGKKSPELKYHGSASGFQVPDPMSTSFYGALPDDDDEDDDQLHQSAITGHDLMTSSFIGELPRDDKAEETVKSWGKPLGLPSPAPPSDNKGTPKKERRLPANVSVKNKLNQRSESPSKKRKFSPVYVDLTYVPHHGNSYYSQVEFFKRVRARYYVFSGIEPSKDVYNALLEAKQTWEDKDLEVTIIPTYDTDVLGYWVAENEELLTKYRIDLSPSASRCTINLQDHETSCSAYRLEF